MQRYRFVIVVLPLMWLLAAPGAAQWMMRQAQQPSTTVEEQQGQDLYNKPSRSKTGWQ
jgi:Tfp pilus assembly protein FimT